MAAMAVLEYLQRVLKSRWMVMVAGMYLMASAGAAYDFSVYSQRLKESMGLDQKDLNTISLFLGVGDGVGFIAGLLYDLWALPAGVMAVGAMLNAVGYLLAWLALTGRLLSRPRVWHFCLFLAVGANAQTFPETAVMVVALRNFPHSRGTVLGLVKGFYGLSGAILPQIYYAIFGDVPASFLLLAACLPSLVSLLCMFLMRYVDDNARQARDATTMRYFHGIAVTLSVYLMVILVVQNVVSLSRPVVAGLTSLMILILSLPLVVVFWVEATNKAASQQSTLSVTQDQHDRHKQHASTVQNGSSEQVELQAVANGHHSLGHPLQDADKECSTPSLDAASLEAATRHEHHSPLKPLQPQASKPLPPPESKHRPWILRCLDIAASSSRIPRGEDHSILQALMSLDLWILFLALTCGLGATMALLNNMAQVGFSQSYSTIKINTLIALVSIWNFFGRILAGSLSDMFMDRQAGSSSWYAVLKSRPAIFCISMAALVVANLLIAMGVNGALYIGSVLTGLSLGAQYTLTAVIVSELYGLKVLGTIYTVLACAGPLGTYVLSIRVAGVLYDDQASKQSSGSPSLLCRGPQCFRSTFFIMTGVTAFGVLLSALLTLRTRAFYKINRSARA